MRNYWASSTPMLLAAIALALFFPCEHSPGPLASGPRKVLRDQPGPILAAAFSHDGKLLATGSYPSDHGDGTLVLWNTATWQVSKKIRHPNGVSAVGFSRDDRLVAAGVRRYGILLYDVGTGRLIRTLPDTDIPWDLTFSPDGRLLAAANFGPPVVVWDVSSGEPVYTKDDGRYPVGFSPDGKLFACGEMDHPGEITLTNTASWQAVKTLSKHVHYAESLCFSPDGKLLASGGLDEVIRLWDVERGEQIRKIGGQRRPVASLAFTPNGRLLANGDWGRVNLWEVPSGRSRGRLNGKSGEVNALAISPDGTTLAAGTRDVLEIWDLPSR